MKILEEIKDDYANEQGRDNWEEYFKWLDLCHTPHDVMQKHYDEIAKRYATEYAKEALNKASENAILIKESQYTAGLGLSGLLYEDTLVLDKQSILSEDNLPKH